MDSWDNQTRRELLRKTATAGTGALGLGALSLGTVRGQDVVLAIGEVGTIRTKQPGPNTWFTQELNGGYLSTPVVIMKPVSSNGSHPCHIRLRNVTTHSFEYQIEEWNYLDGQHMRERFYYIAVEPGAYTLSGPGTGIEAGHRPVNTTAQHVTFQATYTQEPIVLTQSQTHEGPDAIVTRTQVSSPNAFTTQLQEEEGGDGGDGDPYHETETVGYIAFERPASGQLTPVSTAFEVGRTPNAVTDEYYRATFDQTFDQVPRLLADMQTMDGPDTAELRYQNLGKSGVDLRVEEEQSFDPETNHATEQVGYVVFGDDGLIPGMTIAV